MRNGRVLALLLGIWRPEPFRASLGIPASEARSMLRSAAVHPPEWSGRRLDVSLRTPDARAFTLMVIRKNRGNGYQRRFRGELVERPGEAFVTGAFRVTPFARAFTALAVGFAALWSLLVVAGAVASAVQGHWGRSGLLLLVSLMPAWLLLGLLSIVKLAEDWERQDRQILGRWFATGVLEDHVKEL